MTERVAELLERVQQLSAEEREEFEQALLARPEPEGDENDALDDEASDEAVRRLRVLQQGGQRGRTVDAYFDELEARARAKSA